MLRQNELTIKILYFYSFYTICTHCLTPAIYDFIDIISTITLNKLLTSIVRLCLSVLSYVLKVKSAKLNHSLQALNCAFFTLVYSLSFVLLLLSSLINNLRQWIKVT